MWVWVCVCVCVCVCGCVHVHEHEHAHMHVHEHVHMHVHVHVHIHVRTCSGSASAASGSSEASSGDQRAASWSLSTTAQRATATRSALAPPVSRVGLQTDFRTEPTELLYGGDAKVEGGVLKLTNNVMPTLNPPNTNPQTPMYTIEKAGWVRTHFAPPQQELTTDQIKTVAAHLHAQLADGGADAGTASARAGTAR